MNNACRFRTLNEKSLVFAFSGHSGLNGPDDEVRKLREASSFKCRDPNNGINNGLNDILLVTFLRHCKIREPNDFIHSDSDCQSGNSKFKPHF